MHGCTIKALNDVELAKKMFLSHHAFRNLSATEIAAIIYSHIRDNNFRNVLIDVFQTEHISAEQISEIAKNNFQVALFFLEIPQIESLLNPITKAYIIQKHCDDVPFIAGLTKEYIKKIALAHPKAALILLRILKHTNHFSEDDTNEIIARHKLKKDFLATHNEQADCEQCCSCYLEHLLAEEI